MIGFIILVYIITPISYWSNEFNSQRFPIFGTGLYDENGQAYNLSRVLKDKSLEFRLDGYESYSKVYLSVTFAYQHAFCFAAFSATFVHVALFHGRDFWRQFKESKKGGTPDIHSKMMNKYESVPQWWFHAIWIPTLGLSMLVCEGFGKQLQLPFWGVLLAVFMVFIVILPLDAIAATTGQGISLDIPLEMMIGYLYPGKPLANQAFNAYGTATIGSAFSFIQDFKVGQYLKVPPKSMFAAQVVGAIVSIIGEFGVTWWLFSSVKNICHADLLPKGSPWTCPISNKVSSVTSLWGIIGPARVFYPNGVYSRLMISFAIDQDEQVEDHPIEQVRLTVPPTDDPTLPAFTFRVLVIGLSSCILSSSLGKFFSFRRNPIAIELVFFQLLALPAGRLMAATLPKRLIKVPCTSWKFSLNPGPFNIKEHVLITTMAKGSYGTASDIIVTMKAFYHRPLNPWAALLLMLTTEMLGFGFAGMFKRFLVDSPYMWWPFVLMDVSFYRTLNEKESRPKGMLSKLQFFTSVFVLSFAYYIIPNYFFPSIGALSLACLIWKNSVIAHQLGSGLNGLGLGTFYL
ncbi:hypothetical protein J5N97_005272 [Dioscorea zingiberensis]|uniref:Oligopeptide transporter n=1 Tax=Dioscorea zingiberensis TaxID=325984 RepID=A0A9D5D7T6_9LILI|nr:hypothetical protein J5N97_005272 [Dioscorea zingiberensis]